MIETRLRTIGEPVEENLRVQVARGDDLARSVQPVLRHLLGNQNSTLFGDQIVARVRGIQTHLARRLLVACGTGADGGACDGPLQLFLTQALSERSTILVHLHALALEWQLAERLEQDFAVDPVVPPLLQALISSPDAETQDLAMKLLAAQARWCQAQRRMQLAVAELPGELLHEALLVLRSVCGDAASKAETTIRAAYVESASRLGLAARLVTGMGSAAQVALDLRHGGSALFATALALGSGQSREAVILSTHEGQTTRLALELRAAGLPMAAVEHQLLLLHGEATLPAGFDRLGAEQAATILRDIHDAQR
jgi:hypothetical protein